MVQSRAAAQQAAALAAVARTVRLQRVPAAADVQTEPVPAAAGADRPRRLVDVLEAGAGFAAGYALGARGEGRRFDRLTRTPTNWARSPQVQQAMGRVRVRATDTWQAGSAQVSRRAGGVTERVRRRSDRSGEAPARFRGLEPGELAPTPARGGAAGARSRVRRASLDLLRTAYGGPVPRAETAPHGAGIVRPARP